MSAVAALTRAWQGMVAVVAGDRQAAAAAFEPTRLGLATALGWLALALLLSAAAQAALAGLPGLDQVLFGLVVQALAVGTLGLVMARSLKFLKLDVPLLALLVPTVYGLALVQVVAILLALIGPNAQFVALVALAALIGRIAAAIGGLRLGPAVAFALLGVLVLVVVPNALYIVLLHPSAPA
jgi:hypothetical protein